MHRRRYTPIIYVILVLAFTVYIFLDTFVISKSYQTVEVVNANNSTAVSEDSLSDSEEAVTTQTSITISTDHQYDSDFYVADIVLGENDSIYTALAENTYGSNITETTSTIAENVGATLAINGDFYGVQSEGYVIRNGELLRSTMKSSDQEDLVIYEDGTIDIIQEGDITAEALVENGAYNVLSFGPGLVEDGEISVESTEEENNARTLVNPRTAIGQISEDHYVFVVVDGRTDESTGVSLAELATFMQSLGCTEAYNLDGGGSSTLYYNGEVLNNPTTSGRTFEERAVSDIVYIS